MHGVKRVVIFCALTTLLPIFMLIMPLYLRHNRYADVAYAVTESDVLEINDGVSTIFCAEHTLYMNGTFNAFQMGHRPEITASRKHIRLKKSMILPDDTLEYWGFYLLRGASVVLSVCSRFPGASILVVKGERTLPTCGMLEHNQNKARTAGVFLPESQGQVKITFESNAHEIMESEELKSATAKNNKVNEQVTKRENKATHYTSVHQHITGIASRKMDAPKKIRHSKNRLNHSDHHLDFSKSKDAIRRRRNSRQQNFNNLEDDLKLPVLDSSAEEDKYISGFERRKRNQEPMKPPALLDQGIKHGGNAVRNLTADQDSSVSSFEEGLLNCYMGNVLVKQEFDPSELCTNVSYLESGKAMQAYHNVTEDGYYYYIFYSDNDFVSNDIHAIFDIYKPTFQYENVTQSCINDTKCSFKLSMLSADRVIVEVPTKDGIEHEADDISLLISVCHPRMGMYIIFPIAVLLLILTCAFL